MYNSVNSSYLVYSTFLMEENTVGEQQTFEEDEFVEQNVKR